MTRRSRSSFDLRDALTTAEALSPKPPAAEPSPVEYGGGVPLVAFGPSDAPATAPSPAAAPAPATPPAPAVAPRSALGDPPDVSSTSGLIPRLSALIDWLRTDPEVSRVIVVDEEGLPLVGATAGDLSDAESLLAATGTVASAMKKLALATPGALSRDFEGHVGDGPVLQLVGLSAGSRSFVVGVSRRKPLAGRDVELVREAFVEALEGVGGRGGRVGDP